MFKNKTQVEPSIQPLFPTIHSKVHRGVSKYQQQSPLLIIGIIDQLVLPPTASISPPRLTARTTRIIFPADKARNCKTTKLHLVRQLIHPIVEVLRQVAQWRMRSLQARFNQGTTPSSLGMPVRSEEVAM